MKRLHDKVNIIPLIAKADTLTPDECASFKKTILNEIAQHGIKIYEFPDAEDEDENRSQKAFKERVPFAVVGSNTTVEVNGKKGQFFFTGEIMEGDEYLPCWLSARCTMY